MPELPDQPDQLGTGLLAAGTTIGERYRVQRFLGEGERKHTYLAEDTHLGVRWRSGS